MIRTRSRLVNPLTSPKGRGNAAIDTANLIYAFALAAATGTLVVLRGTYVIRFEQVAWFYWYNSLANPVYGAVPVASGLKVDATQATFRMERASWMGSQTRSAMFYTPGFSTTAGRVSDIEWRGGTFDFTRTGATATPTHTNAFGLVGVDDFKIEYTRFIGADGEKLGRGGFMLNGRSPRLRNCTYKNIAQGHYMAFTDDGNSSGMRFENLAEGIDFDLPCRGWLVFSTHAKSLTEQVWDGGTIDRCLFHGLVASDIPNVIQIYAKSGNWQTFAELWDHLGAVSVTFDTTADTITFGDVVSGVAPNNPVIANGRHIGLNLVGTLPTGTAVETLYYLVNVSGRTAQLSLTEGGAAINLSGSPTADNTANFYPNVMRVSEKVTVSGVKALSMTNGGAMVTISNLRQGGNFYLGSSVQCRDITLYDWHLEGGGVVLINEGTNIIVDKMTLRNCTPQRDKKIGYAFVAREASAGGNASASSYLSLRVSRLTIDGSTQGGAAVSGATKLTWDDVKISGFVGEQWTENAVTYDTRIGFALVRAGSKAGAVLTVGKTDVRGGPNNCTDLLFDDFNNPDGAYVLDLTGPLNLASNQTATGVTPCDIRISSDVTRDAFLNKITVPFNDGVNTTASGSARKFAYSDRKKTAKVFGCSVKTRDAITGSGSNNSKVTLVRNAGSGGGTITNATLILDPASVAADAERLMPIDGSASNATIAPGETLMARVEAGTGSGSTSPPFTLNLSVVEYTSVA